MKLEPGVAVPLTAPQSQLYDVGGSLTLKALFGVNKYLDIGPSVTLLQLPAVAALTEPGTAWTFGGGLRFKRPHDAPGGGVAAVLITQLVVPERAGERG